MCFGVPAFLMHCSIIKSLSVQMPLLSNNEKVRAEVFPLDMPGLIHFSAHICESLYFN